MTTQTTTTDVKTFPVTALPVNDRTSKRLFAPGAPASYDDFRDDLLRDGFALVKGAVPRDRAEKYGNEMFQFLEEL